MKSPSFLASEHAIRTVPNPCTGCTERKAACSGSCAKRPEYLKALEVEKEKFLKAYRRENIAPQFLATSARATQRKLSGRKSKYG